MSPIRATQLTNRLVPTIVSASDSCNFLRKVQAVIELCNTLLQLVYVLGKLAGEVLGLALAGSLLIAYVAWWLWAVNWKRMWPVLAQGAWAPLVLLMLTSALVWSRISPSDCTCLPFVTVPNFWWQLGEVGLLVAVALFCGWLQGVFGWTPAEISLEPPVDHGEAHGHGEVHHDVGESHAAEDTHGHEHH